MSGEHFEVVVRVKHRYRHAYGCSADKTVNQSPNCLAAAAASTVQSSGLLVIGRLGGHK